MNDIRFSNKEFNTNHILKFLKRDEHDGTIYLNDQSVVKALFWKSEPLLIEIFFNDHKLSYRSLNDTHLSQDEIRQFITHYFDLNSHYATFYTQLDSFDMGKKLKSACYGFRVIALPSLFEALSWSILGQQINVQFAIELKRRFVEQYGITLAGDKRALKAFPRVEDLSEVKQSDLEALHFGKYKSIYILNARDFCLEKDEKTLHQLNDNTLFDHLIQIKGIGEWSAQYVMLKFFRRLSQFPFKDVGLQNALKIIGDLDQKPNRAEIENILKNVHPYEGLFAQYLYLYLQL